MLNDGMDRRCMGPNVTALDALPVAAAARCHRPLTGGASESREQVRGRIWQRQRARKHLEMVGVGAKECLEEGGAAGTKAAAREADRGKGEGAVREAEPDAVAEGTSERREQGEERGHESTRTDERTEQVRRGRTVRP